MFQTGSGTSSNMNANEVIATLAGREAASDHVNMGQSSNDVFPSAMPSPRFEEISRHLLPALDRLASALGAQGRRVLRCREGGGRTHLMDAVPVTLGQGIRRLLGPGPARPRADRGHPAPARPDPAGRRRDGHRPQHPPEFAERVRELLMADTGLPIGAPADPFEAQGARDGLVEGIGRPQGTRQPWRSRRSPTASPGWAAAALRPGRDLPARAPEGARRSCRARSTP